MCAPAIVRIESLMPVRGIIFPGERHRYGFLERLLVHSYLPPITEMQNMGLSAHGIAAKLNSRGSTAINGDAWDAQRVMYVIRCDEMIRCEDAIRRAFLMVRLMPTHKFKIARRPPRGEINRRILLTTSSVHGRVNDHDHKNGTQNDHPIGNLNACYRCLFVKPFHGFRPIFSSSPPRRGDGNCPSH